jgi:hypothetical protein
MATSLKELYQAGAEDVSRQLAVALHFHRSFPIDHFVCADQRLDPRRSA